MRQRSAGPAAFLLALAFLACDDVAQQPTPEWRPAWPAAASTAGEATGDAAGEATAAATGGNARYVASTRNERGQCVVERVSDGDTVVCSGDPVRLLLIDAPEGRQQDLGLRARLALEELIPVGTRVRLELDVERRDPYRRLLAHLHRGDGTWINRAMVRRGYAVVLVYPPNVRHVETMRAAADSARTEGAGLWAERGFDCEPRDFRRGSCR